MSFNALSWSMEQELPDTKCFAVLTAMANYADDRGVCWPSQQTLADKTKLARETVSRTITKLVKIGKVSRLKRGYQLNIHVTDAHTDVIVDHNNVTEDHIGEVEQCDGGSQVCDTGSHRCDGGSQPSEPVNKQSINSQKKTIEKEIGFEDFWEAYPRQTGIGAARQQFTNQIMFHAADPVQMLKAAKSFARKHEDTEEQFIPKPCNFLNDQTYLDPDLQRSTEIDTSTWPDWKRDVAAIIGGKEAFSWFIGAEIDGNTVYVKNKFIANWIENNYSAALAKVLGKQYKIKLLGDAHG